MSDQPAKLPPTAVGDDSRIAIETLSNLASQQIDEEFKISERLDSKVRSIAQIGLVGFAAAQTVLVSSLDELRTAALSSLEVGLLVALTAGAILSSIALSIMAIVKLRHRERQAVGMQQVRERLVPHAVEDPGDGRVATTAMQLKLDIAEERQAENLAASSGQGVFVAVAIIGILLAATQIAAVSILVAFA